MRTFRTGHGLVVIALAGALVVASVPRAAAGEPDPVDRAADSTKADLVAIRDRAEAMPIEQRIDMDKRIHAMIQRVNDTVAKQGKSAIASRLAPRFGMSSDALLDEKGRLGWSWGDVVLAYTLLGNADHPVTLAELETLRSEGLGWAAIAYGLPFHMEDLEDVIKAGGKIASGISGSSDTSPATP